MASNKRSYSAVAQGDEEPPLKYMRPLLTGMKRYAEAALDNHSGLTLFTATAAQAISPISSSNARVGSGKFTRPSSVPSRTSSTRLSTTGMFVS